jgi:hypothetical protein
MIHEMAQVRVHSGVENGVGRNGGVETAGRSGPYKVSDPEAVGEGFSSPEVEVEPNVLIDRGCLLAS